MEQLNGDQDDPVQDAHQLNEGDGSRELQFEEDEDWKLEEEYQDELQDGLQQTSVIFSVSVEFLSMLIGYC